MKKLNLILAGALLAILGGCSGSNGGSDSSIPTGTGPLATLADKYAEMGVKDKEFSEKIEAAGEDGDKVGKLVYERRQMSDLLESEAKSAAESLVGTTIPCTTSPRAGLISAECVVSAASAGSSSARVVLDFKTEPRMVAPLGCLLENSKGEVIEKLKLFINGEGTPQIVYMFSSGKGGKSAIQASDLAKIKLVTDEEYDAATKVTD